MTGYERRFEQFETSPDMIRFSKGQGAISKGHSQRGERTVKRALYRGERTVKRAL